MTDRNPYRATLNVLGRNGKYWNKGAYDRIRSSFLGPHHVYCLVGAVREAVGRGWERELPLLCAVIGERCITSWNDRQWRTWPEVRDVLNAAAEVWDLRHAERPEPPTEPEPVPLPSGTPVTKPKEPEFVLVGG
jgi:hypothetical protein